MANDSLKYSAENKFVWKQTHLDQQCVSLLHRILLFHYTFWHKPHLLLQKILMFYYMFLHKPNSDQIHVSQPYNMPPKMVQILSILMRLFHRFCASPCNVDWHLLRLTLTILLTSQMANSFSRPLSQVTVCTIFSLLKPPPTVLISFVRSSIHICFPLFSIRSLKTLISIVVYLNMYNPLIVILCFLSVHFVRCMLCVSHFFVFCVFYHCFI